MENQARPWRFLPAACLRPSSTSFIVSLRSYLVNQSNFNTIERMDRYNPSKIEAKWKKKWLSAKIYEPDFLAPLEVSPDVTSGLPLRKCSGLLTGGAVKKPFYNLMIFPYPSAEGLHIGGVRTFTGVDIYGRFKRMQGYDVFEPIGLDGFGIHSENYALKIGKHPAKLATVTEKNFYRQLSEIGNGFAWQERLETYDPEYYKWTQWIFI